MVAEFVCQGRRVHLRPVNDQDLPFLRQVYGSTRAGELAQVPWSEADKAGFVAMQFHAQHTHYQQHFPDAEYLVVLVEDQPAGRLYIDHRSDEIRVIDIALLPDYRGAGVGGALMQQILDQAARAGQCVRIHVEQLNRALRLYRRLGFTKVAMQGIYHLMEWRPPAAPGRMSPGAQDSSRERGEGS